MKKTRIPIAIFLTGLMILIPLSSCGVFNSSDETEAKANLAETVFEVTLPEPLNENEILYFEMLDETTGIALNPTRYEMEAKDDYSYFVRIPLVIGTLVKYRYVREGTTSNLIEYDTNGNMVQYRLSLIKKASVVSDFVSGWNAQAFSGSAGEVSGFIYDSDSETPLPEVMVCINGMKTFTSSDGYYEIKNIPSGEYNLVALQLDGTYKTFQQGAVIAANSITPASFGMESADLVEITFIVTPPEEEVTSGELRFISNLYTLGNTYSEMDGGVSVLPSSAPTLELQSNGEYSLTLEIPEGFDLQYKYSLGDGFINAEHANDGSYRIRQLIVPDKDTKIYNTVQSWYSSGSSPLTFNVSVPENTPDSEVISIQFNPFVWMEPIPMQKSASNQWTFTLYSPQEYLNNSQFRFCRNYQCGLADDALTSGKNATGYGLNLDDPALQNIDYNLENWAGLQPTDYAFQPIGVPENNMYIKGFELDKDFDKKDAETYEWGIVNAAVSGANLLILSPTWTFPDNSTNGIMLQSGSDLLYSDLDQIEEFSQDTDLSLGLYPQPRYSSGSSNYWNESDLTYNWWKDWFDSYTRFILHYADYAEVNGIQTLIIGGSQVSTAFPYGTLPNGNPANTPYDMTDMWSGLIDTIRSRFSGQLFFALPYSNDLSDQPDYLGKVDAIYVEMDSALTASNSPTLDEIKSRLAMIMDGDLYKLYATFQKPVVLGFDYASIDGSAADCLNYSSSCKDYLQSQANPFDKVDLNEQAMLVQAITEEAVQRNWIYGLVAKGYNPSVAVQDNSSSIYGKPADEVLSYYYNVITR